MEEALIDTEDKTTFINETGISHNGLHVIIMDKNILIKLENKMCSQEAIDQLKEIITIEKHNSQICAIVIKLNIIVLN